MRPVDVIVAGGGPAGVAAAAAAVGAGLDVLLVDRAARRPPRGETLPPAGLALLRDLRLPCPDVSSGHREVAGLRSIWGTPAVVDRDYLYSRGGAQWMLDRERFDQDLRSAVAVRGVALWSDSAQTVEPSAVGWSVEMSTGRRVHARALIDATGRASTLARALGARPRRGTPLVALHAPVGFDPHEGFRRHVVESGRDGWWFCAHLADGRLAATFFTDVGTSRNLVAQPGAWSAALGRTLHLRRVRGVDLADHVSIGRPHVFDASDVGLDRMAGAGWISCGDAALAFDPLSSHGLVHALNSGARAGSAVARALFGDPLSIDRAVEDERALARLSRSMSADVYAQEARWWNEPFWRARRRTPEEVTSQ